MRDFRSFWDPVSLAFSSDELERHYTRYLVISTFFAVDKVFGYFTLISNACLGFIYWKRDLGSGFLMTAMVNGMCGLTVVLALCRPTRIWFLRYRTPILLLLRSARIISAIYAYSLVPPDVPEWSQFRRIVLFGLLVTYQTCGMPVNLKIHAAHHGFAVAIAFFYLARQDCGNHLDMWQTVFKVLSLSQASELEPEEQCRRVLLLVLFTTGYALPTYILWAMELKSRMNYVTENRIPVRGSIHSYLMLAVLLCASVALWLLILFNL